MMKGTLAMLAMLAVVALAVLQAGCQAPTQTTTPAPCPRPALLANGQYSSYRTQGTMPSGFSVRMSDGDTWTCDNGHVTVH